MYTLTPTLDVRTSGVFIYANNFTYHQKTEENQQQDKTVLNSMYIYGWG